MFSVGGRTGKLKRMRRHGDFVGKRQNSSIFRKSRMYVQNLRQRRKIVRIMTILIPVKLLGIIKLSQLPFAPFILPEWSLRGPLLPARP